MPLRLQEQHTKDLKPLQQMSHRALSQLCRSVWHFLIDGEDLNLGHAASQKFDLEHKELESAVEGLAYLFVEASKHQLNEQLFRETILNQGFTEELFAVLHNELLHHKPALESSLLLTGTQHSHYKSLDWRFETQVASKMVKNQREAKITLKLDLEKGGSIEHVSMECDIQNLLHISDMLYMALNECRTQPS